MYYATFVYLLILLFIAKNFSKKTRFALAAFPLILVAFLRYGVGADYFSYQQLYLNLDGLSIVEILSLSNGIEPGFNLMMAFFHMLGISPHMFLAIISTIITLLSLKWIEDNSVNFEISVLLYYSMLYFYWSLSALRQGIVLIVMIFIFFNKTKNYSLRIKILVTIIMMTFHPTAIIVPILYLISILNWNIMKLILFLLTSPIVKILIKPITEIIVSILPFSSKLLKYINYNSIKLISLPSLMRLFIIVMILINYNRLIQTYGERKKIINFALVGLIGYFYLPMAMVVGTRVTIFSYFMIIIIFSMIFEIHKNKFSELSYLTIIAFSVVMFSNEYVKLVDRTGYNLSKHKLNFETIYNGSMLNFNKPQVFNLMHREFLTNRLSSTSMKERVNTVFEHPEAKYDSSNEHFGVKFSSNGKYGIINQKGEVIVLPIYKYEPVIYGKYIRIREETYEENRYSYYFEDMSEIVVSNTHDKEQKDDYIPTRYLYEDIKDYLDDELLRKYNYKFSLLVDTDKKVQDLSEHPYLNKYNQSMIVWLRNYYYEINPSIVYVRIITSKQEYVLITNNGSPFIENLFTSVIPYNEKGIAIGFNKDIKEYINTKGEIIWMENLEK